jgi:hypothetical protein
LDETLLTVSAASLAAVVLLTGRGATLRGAVTCDGVLAAADVLKGAVDLAWVSAADEFAGLPVVLVAVVDGAPDFNLDMSEGFLLDFALTWPFGAGATSVTLSSDSSWPIRRSSKLRTSGQT